MYTQMDEINLTNDLLCVLGLSINQTDNILIDQDTQQPLLFEGKNIKATNNPIKPAYISENDVKLEPMNPRAVRLMNRIFGYYLDKAASDGDIKKSISFNFDEVDPETKLFKLVVKFFDGTKYESMPYRNRSLLYTATIMELDGSFPGRNYAIFDIDEDVEVK